VQGLPFDHARGVLPHEQGRVLDPDGRPVPGIYTTGWIKRGPVGLIGHTKSDALETIGCVLADASSLPEVPPSGRGDVAVLLGSRSVAYTTWEGWLALDAHEKLLGEASTSAVEGRQVIRERIKVVSRDEMVRVSHPLGAARSR
jgi:ferredoxin--NADP+ reductase